MSVEPDEEISASLRRWRKARRLAASTVAAQAGIHKSTLARWESGTHLPGIPELEALLNALGIEAQDRVDILSRLSAPRAVRHLRDEYHTDGAMPVGGDLLRALRVRKGLTQTETARATDATQSQIAKWERSEAWPDVTRLHTLCQALAATPEEVAALTTGRYGVHDETPRAITKDEQFWQERVKQTLYSAPVPVLDLFFLSLETDLWNLRSEPFALPLLSAAYANHARAHTFHQSPVRAGIWAERSLAIAREHRTTSEEWAAAVIAAGAAYAGGKQRGSLPQAVAVMEEWLPALKIPSYRAWVMSDLSFYYARLGDADTAMHRNIQAQKEARGDITEAMFRQRDHAQLLLILGRYREALDALQAGEAITAESEDAFVRHRLLEAECLVNLGSSAAAEEQLEQAAGAMQANRLPHLAPHYDKLRRRL